VRACRSVVVLGALAYCALVLAATPASAKLAAKPLSFSLGPVGTPNALSIDQGTGDVYVTDHATNTVKVFGAEGGAPTGGAPAEVTGASTPSRAFNFLGQNEPAGIAVDAAGNLYVADVGNKVVDRFKLEGGEYKYVCQFTGFGNAGNGCLPNLTTQETHPTKSFTGPGGIAIDSKGNIYVSDFSGAVYEFNSSDEDVREAHIPSGEPSGLAVDANGVVYVQDYQGPVYKLTLNVTNEFEVAEFDAEKSFAVAVDPINNNVYVDHRVYIDLYESGAIILEIRPSGEMLSEGVAVRVKGASRYLYASNTRRARIEVFEFTKTPDVRLNGEAPVVGVHSAMVHGEINPQETGQPSYFFEYGLNHQFTFSSLSIPVASVNEFVPAAAELTELQPNTEYSYRLVGTNSSELFEKSSGGTFRTLTARPEVAAVKAGEVTANGVLFSGEVNPENTPPATYRFEYYEPGGGFQSLPRIAIGAGDSPVPVEQALPAGLELRSPSRSAFPCGLPCRYQLERTFRGQGLNEYPGLQKIFGGLRLIPPFDRDHKLVHRITLGTGYRHRHPTTKQQHRALWLMDQKIQMPKRLRTGIRQRLHSGRLSLMPVGAPVRRQEIHPIASPIAVLS